MEKLRHSKGAVSPQLQSGPSLCVSSYNYFPRWSSRQLWNFQTMKPPDTNSWVVPSTCLKFRNRDLCCTIHRKKPRLQYISLGCCFGHFIIFLFFLITSTFRSHLLDCHYGKSNDSFSGWKFVENNPKITVWDMHRKIHTWPNYISKIGREPLMAFPRAQSCAIYCQTRAKRNQNEIHPRAFT